MYCQIETFLYKVNDSVIQFKINIYLWVLLHVSGNYRGQLQDAKGERGIDP